MQQALRMPLWSFAARPDEECKDSERREIGKRAELEIRRAFLSVETLRNGGRKMEELMRALREEALALGAYRAELVKVELCRAAG